MSSVSSNRLKLLGCLWLVAFTLVYFYPVMQNSGLPRWRIVQLLLLDPPELIPQPRFPDIWLAERAEIFGLALLIGTAALGCGHTLLRLAGCQALGHIERIAFAGGLGLSALSTLTLALGWFGLLSQPVVLGILLLCVLSGVASVWLTPRSATFPTGETSPRGRWVVIATGLVFVTYMALGAVLPSVDFDVNEYHFQGPKEYYQAGRITFLPHNVYTSFPFGTEMLTLLSMTLRQDWYRGALVGKVVLMFFGPLTAVALYAAGRQWFGELCGVVAALVWISMPWTYRISTIAYAEGGLSCYLLLALLAVISAREQRAGKWWLVAGCLAGSGFACKYPGLISVVLPLGALTLWPITVPTNPPATPSLKARFPQSMAVMQFSLGCFLIAGPWLLKNLVETGNPVYPLAWNFFGGIDWDAAMQAKWVKAHSSTDFGPAALGRSLWEITVTNDWLSPLLVGLAPCALLWREQRRLVISLCLYVMWLTATWWLLTHRIDRFFVPQLPVEALLAGIGFAALWNTHNEHKRGTSVVRGGLGVLVVLTTLYHLGFVTSGLCGYNQFGLDLKAARRDVAEITAPDLALLNDRLASGAKVLCVGEAQVFESEFPVLYHTCFDRTLLRDFCLDESGNPRSGDAIRAEFERAGVTHVLVNWMEILRYRTTYGYDDFVTPEVFERLRREKVVRHPWPTHQASRLVSELSESSQKQLEKWGRKLVRSGRVGPEIPRFEIYEILKR